jgi:3'(2'), 5'-bisphosphate nucleotidase/myo-inositol-1(or 4)-monophosphatase
MLSQAVILRYLLPTCITYDIALLSEEQLDDGSRFQQDAFWCIDPLDGTLPFTEGIPGYAVSIALVDQAGTPWIGVVYDPTTQTRYEAIRGQGVWRNGAPWQWHEPESSALQFICDRSVQRLPQFNSLIECLESLAGELETTFTGGAVMNAMWVLERAPACYFKQSKSQVGGGCLWDYAATACIYTELDAWCSDFEGHVLDLNRADSHFMNHRGILFASNAIMAERLLAISCTELG